MAFLLVVVVNDEVISDDRMLFRDVYRCNKFARAIEKGKTVAEICSVNSTNVIAVIEKAGWENALSSSLGYFESEDQFEVCAQINTTLKLLHNERTSKSSEAIT